MGNRGGGGNKTASQQKLSAKGSITRAKETMGGKSLLKKGIGIANTTISTATGGNSSVLKTAIGKAGPAGLIIGAIMTGAEKIADFGINIYEAQTGNEMRSHNARTTVKMISSLGIGFAQAAIQNEIFTKKIISRQNYGIDYGRELYQINVDGTKNKRI